MAIERPWKNLQVEGNFPLLWLKARSDEACLFLQLTDLNKLWGMNLDRAEVIRSAADQGCSIDPSEDDEQYGQFLAKINSALNREKRTSVSVEPGDQPDSLRLSVSAPLPGSLPTFKWSVDLQALNDAGDTSFESELITPLIVYASNLRSQVLQLVEELGHKDRVISKIADKLENSGTDLTQVFPGMSNIRISKKSTQRSQLASHINGLAEFDEETWRFQATKDINDEDPGVEQLDSIFADLPQSGLLSSHKDPNGIWYQTRGRVTVNEGADADIESTESNKINRRRTPAPDRVPSLPEEESIQDGGFQRQATPPSSSRARFDRTAVNDTGHSVTDTRSAGNEDGTTDDDEDDLDAPSQRSASARNASQQHSASSRTMSQSRNSSQLHKPSPEPSKPQKFPKRKLGALGGKKAKSPSPEPPPDAETETDDDDAPATLPVQPKSKSRLGAFGSKAKSKTPPPAVEQEAEAVPDLSDEEVAKPDSPPKRKSKLGGFGGKSKVPPSAEPEASKSPPAKTRSKLGAFGGKLKIQASPVVEEGDGSGVSAGSPKPVGRLGRFGGGAHARNGTEPVAEAEDTTERKPRASVKEDDEEQEREDSEERANKKRERLKRELEEKSKAPVKKKRKF